MPTTVTTHYDLEKPAVEGDQDTWGEKLNADLDALDVLLENRIAKDKTGKDASGEDPQVTAFRVQLPPQTLAATTSGGGILPHEAATALWVEHRLLNALNALFPIRTILLWHGDAGSAAALETAGWCFCDGVTREGVTVPDLRDRIVLCAGPLHLANQSGGVTNPGLGQHIHHIATDQAFDVPTVDPAADYHTYTYGPAIFAPGTTPTPESAVLPYNAVGYIMKFRNWTI